MRQVLLFLAAAAVILSACAPSSVTPTPIPIVESFFSARAFVDANSNGRLDDSDPPLKDAIFIVRMQSVEFGDLTDASGNAFVTVPGPTEYPVAVTMRPPQNSTYELVGPATVELTKPGDKADFLFRSK